MNIVLTPSEYLQAHLGAGLRFTARRKTSSVRAYGQAANLNDEILGVASEMAVAKALNVFYTASPGRPDRDDVAGLQVRCTTRQNGSLIVHPADPDELVCVLVLADLDRLSFTVAGWMRTAEAKRQEWWRTDTGRPAYFVPQHELRSAATLRPAEVAA